MSDVRTGGFRERVPARTSSELKTQQHLKDSVDVNKIVDTYMKTGVWQHVQDRTPMYGDFSAFDDLQSAMTLVRNVEAEFNALPAVVRKAAQNDPAVFFEMLTSPEGCWALQEAGLPFVEPITDPSQPPVREDPAVEPTVPDAAVVADPPPSEPA